MRTLANLRKNVRRLVREVQVPIEDVTGTASVAALGVTVTGVSTEFITEFRVGDEIRLGTEIREVAEIASDTSLTVTRAFAVIHTTAAIARIARFWSDDYILDVINKGYQEVIDTCQSFVPEVLAESPPVYASLVSGVDLVTLPTTLLKPSRPHG